ncbi:MAG: hypothetical protein ACTHN0_06825 [Aquihabitans sp.]
MTDYIRITKPYVPFGPAHLDEDIATAKYLDGVIAKLDAGTANVGGSNVTDTVRKILLEAAQALRDGPPWITDEIPTADAIVEVAARGIRERAAWPSMHWPSITGVNHRDVSLALARAALEALATTRLPTPQTAQPTNDGPESFTDGPTTDAMIDAVAQSMMGLSDKLWAETLADETELTVATVKYYRAHARRALEAAEAARMPRSCDLCATSCTNACVQAAAGAAR